MRINIQDFDDGRAVAPNAWLYLDEITHRTMNDYTVMLAMVRRATLAIADGDGEHALDRITQRLWAASTAYRALSPPRGVSRLNLAENIETLCDALSASVLADRPINLSVASEPVTIGARRCWQISLIVSELVMNAAKHAFSLSQKGSIIVSLCPGRGFIRCEVADDGAADSVVSPGRGASIVDALVTELGGTIARNYTGHGTIVALCVPLEDAPYICRVDSIDC
jgi:two-component sensor histidine kinase